MKKHIFAATLLAFLLSSSVAQAQAIIIGGKSTPVPTSPAVPTPPATGGDDIERSTSDVARVSNTGSIVGC